jgi:flavodoxin
MEEKMKKILIAYFSRAGYNYAGSGIVNLPVGNTETAARIIQKLAGGDLFRIDTVKKYPADYHEATRVAQQEQRSNARPELASQVEHMDDYDIVVLGYPNWWGTMPMAVWTFLESHDFSGKTLLPFCTHEGSGMGHSEGDIKRLCPHATVREGLAVRGGSVQNAEREIVAWLRASGVVK